MEFAKILREKRKALNLTQQELAEKLHVTRQTLSRWENNTMVKQISSDVRGKKKFKRYLIILMSLFVVILLWLGLLGFGRAKQIAWIDRTNPFLSTQYAYAILPDKVPIKKKLEDVIEPNGRKHKEWVKEPQKVNAYVSDDPFGSGEWLKFYTGMYGKDNRWALVAHKGSYVAAVRLVKKKQIPLAMREQAGNDYYPYNAKTDGPRTSKRFSWWPFN